MITCRATDDELREFVPFLHALIGIANDVIRPLTLPTRLLVLRENKP